MSEEKLTEAQKIREWARFYAHLANLLSCYRDYIGKASEVLMHLADVREKTQTDDEGERG